MMIFQKNVKSFRQMQGDKLKCDYKYLNILLMCTICTSEPNEKIQSISVPIKLNCDVEQSFQQLEIQANHSKVLLYPVLILG